MNKLFDKVGDVAYKTKTMFRTVMGERVEEYLDIPGGDGGEGTWDELVHIYGEDTVEEAASTADPVDQFAFAYHPDKDLHYVLALNKNLSSLAAMKILITSAVEEVRVGVILNSNLDRDLLAARLEAIMDSDDDSDFHAAIDRQIDRAREDLPLEEVVLQAIEAKGYDVATELAHAGEDYDSLPRI